MPLSLSASSSSLKNKLASHIARLKSEEASKPILAEDTLLFWGTPEDRAYLPSLKSCVESFTTHLSLDPITTLMQVKLLCKTKKVNKVVTTSVPLLKKLLKWDKRKAPSLSNYSGSYFTLSGFAADLPEIEIVFIQPLKQLQTITYGKFLATRTIRKLTKPEKWYVPTEFSWELLTASNEADKFRELAKSFMVSVDIETFRENAAIRCISYTGFFYDTSHESGMRSTTIVLPIDSDYNLALLRKFNWELPAPKVLQGGKYDIAYLARYNAPVYNYLYDTANMFHAWYSELPKDLGFLNAFFIRKAFYWKDLSETNDLYEYYRYNGLDTWGTGNAFLAMLLEAPKYALENYLLEFPLTFPCHLSEMTGIARDMDRLEVAEKVATKLITKAKTSLNTILAIPEGSEFNTNSPKQVKSVLKMLGCGDLPSTNAISLEKARFRHPFNARIINLITGTRKARKLVSTYLTKGKEFTTLRPAGKPSKVLYALNPNGTDSSRLASREHHFWCGLQVQNIPRGPAVKCTLKADKGFLLAEADLEQAESRDTAYIAGEENLIAAVEHSPDFHSANASAFFGTPFEKIFDVATCKVLDKALRDLAKRVNHGANYNMGAYVLIDTMGEAKILLAKKLLGLPRFWGYVAVAEHLLAQFHTTYPGIKKVFYTGVTKEILLTRKLTSTAFHHTEAMGDLYGTDLSEKAYKEWYAKQTGAWTRYCFGNPDRSKRDLNSYISHPPQALNAQTLNKGYLKVFNKIALHPLHRNNFKLLAQIHDSILFQYRIGHEYLCEEVKRLMEIPVTVRGYDNKLRTFIVPSSVKAGIAGKKAIYWSETE